MISKKIYLKLRSLFRVHIKHFYYRLFVPYNRAKKKQWIESPAGHSIEISSICNFDCVFCAYQKTDKDKRLIMSQEDFQHAVDEVVSVGGSSVGLTPLTGDVFVDKEGLENKIYYLEQHQGITEYSFTTNLSLLSDQQLEMMEGLRKISTLKISIYGHDQESFTKITRTKNYSKVLTNLNRVYSSLSRLPFRINIGIRSYADFSPTKNQSELMDAINNLGKSDKVTVGYHRHYTNWGGAVTQEDLDGLPVILKDDKNGYKSGPCARLFAYMVLSNSDVILCACRDAYREMVIGNIKHSPLKEIISITNPDYAQWVNDQENDLFNGPCKDCDMYRPVYSLPHYELGKNVKRNYVTYSQYFGDNFVDYIKY